MRKRIRWWYEWSRMKFLAIFGLKPKWLKNLERWEAEDE